MVLLIAWVIVVLAFFILAVQVFVTILEFKLVTLAGFVLIPFAFFGRTAFMAERVLGHIISSGIKVLVLAVITGIGTTLFDRFLDAGIGPEPDIEQAMAIALGALKIGRASWRERVCQYVEISVVSVSLNTKQQTLCTRVNHSTLTK